ncbi:fungal specific transcription factor domain-containing protein [Rutstroemia sp. NJR-2017a BBW]|nr:fungal specific transcription factor domain-containing protein [Rutstroemia sp. NJR-2017a BBW]PQE08633.1 fungal specific transcription factor domain-containing protein [Rutstroemia sp. NJR-2017a BBW]
MGGGKEVDSSSSTPAIKPLPPAQEWLKPGPAYIAPTSGFFFGQAGQQASLIDFLPSKLAADRLMKQYFVAVHPIAQVLHRPSFDKEYDTFWDEVSLGIEPPSSVQAIVFAAMFAAVVSMDPSAIIRDFGVAKESLVDNFKLGTETALNRANFLRTTKIETLQAFILYMVRIPLCRAEVSRAHSVLVGAAIRMAECMGLHRDGEYYGLSPLETHVRRLIWHQLCFLDIRTCEAQGPRPSIRRDDFDTKLPLNVDDIELHNTGKPPESAERWTDATFSLIRFEINEMNRTIWIDRRRVQQRKISLTAVLSKIETFRQNMAKYDSLMDDRVPVQRCARIVKTLLLARLHVMLLHSYHNPVQSRMPDRLLQIMVTSGLQSLECAIALETIPDIKTWEWYSGAFQQYHTAFLLLVEIYANPHRKEADRIWSCIDYVFVTNSFEPRLTKARKVLSELQQKTAMYAQMRGMRAPLIMNKHVGPKQPQLTASDERISKSQASGLETPDSSSVGRVPVSDVLMAQNSVNEPFWTMPDRRASYETSSETSSPMPQQTPTQTPNINDDIMADIDWVKSLYSFQECTEADLLAGDIRCVVPARAVSGTRHPSLANHHFNTLLSFGVLLGTCFSLFG